MTTAADTAPGTDEQPPAPKTINDFVIGRVYTAGEVGEFFGRTRAWAALACKQKRFPNAFQQQGSGWWMIPGSDVRAMYGEKLIQLERAAVAAASRALVAWAMYSRRSSAAAPPPAGPPAGCGPVRIRCCGCGSI